MIRLALLNCRADGGALARMPLAGQTSSGHGGGGGRGSASGSHEWAVRGTVPDLAARWAELKPNLAMQHPFELDTFQKVMVITITIIGNANAYGMIKTMHFLCCICLNAAPV